MSTVRPNKYTRDERRETRERARARSFEKKFFAFLTRSIAERTRVRVVQLSSIGKRCRSSVLRFLSVAPCYTPICAPLGRMRRYAGNLFCLCSMARKFARGTYASRAVPLRSDEYVDSIRLLVRSLLPSLPSILIRSRRRA